jgi:single-strand DNA-binding protein
MQIRNTITLIGNVGKTPELLNTAKGEPMLRFSLATNEYWKDKDGNRQTRTEWHNIVVFGTRVDYLKKIITKGALVAVSGTLRYNKWVDKHEQSRTTAQVHLGDVQVLTSKTVDQDEAVAA